MPLLALARVPQMPEPLMRGDEALHAAAAPAIGREWPARQHQLEGDQKMIGNLEIVNVASVMKRN